MVTIYGELTADRRDIVLMALGGTEEVAVAAKRLETMTPLFHKSNPPGAMTVAASWPVTVQLAHVFGDAWQCGPKLQEWCTAEVLRRTNRLEQRYTAPSGLTPYWWQLEGAAMVGATGKGLLTDDPGTGKTVTAILGLIEHQLYEAEHGRRTLPILVACPASVLDTWVEHFRRWAPQWHTIPWRGTKRHNWVGAADVYVASYDTIARDAPAGERGPLTYLAPKSFVLDECHLIKTPGTKRSQAARRLAKSCNVVVGMSGTPITHNSGDLWPVLYAMDPTAYPSRERYADRYLETVRGDYKDEVLGLSPYTEPEFRMSLTGQMRRVAKADVLADLPDKVYSTRVVQLPPAWRKVYDQFQEDMIAQLPDGDELTVMHVMSQMTHLSSLASAAADIMRVAELVEDTDPFSPTFGQQIEKQRVSLTLKDPSWKVDALLEILAERPLNSVLAFAPSRQLMVLAGRRAERAGRRVGYIVGGQSAGQRTATVNAFQSGDLDLICATTQAGGVGLTLTAASTVVFLRRPWSMVESIQAEDRAHRIGQTAESVEIIDIIAADTIDTRVRDILRERAGALSELVQDPRIVAELLGGADRPVLPTVANVGQLV